MTTPTYKVGDPVRVVIEDATYFETHGGSIGVKHPGDNGVTWVHPATPGVTITPHRTPGHYGPYSPGPAHDQARIDEIKLIHGSCDPLQCNWQVLLAAVQGNDAGRIKELEAQNVKLKADIAMRVDAARTIMVGRDKISDGLVTHIAELRADLAAANARANALEKELAEARAVIADKAAELGRELAPTADA